MEGKMKRRKTQDLGCKEEFKVSTNVLNRCVNF